MVCLLQLYGYVNSCNLVWLMYLRVYPLNNNDAIHGNMKKGVELRCKKRALIFIEHINRLFIRPRFVR